MERFRGARFNAQFTEFSKSSAPRLVQRHEAPHHLRPRAPLLQALEHQIEQVAAAYIRYE